jgi:hypothetical protein
MSSQTSTSPAHGGSPTTIRTRNAQRVGRPRRQCLRTLVLFVTVAASMAACGGGAAKPANPPRCPWPNGCRRKGQERALLRAGSVDHAAVGFDADADSQRTDPSNVDRPARVQLINTLGGRTCGPAHTEHGVSISAGYGPSIRWLVEPIRPLTRTCHNHGLCRVEQPDEQPTARTVTDVPDPPRTPGGGRRASATAPVPTRNA